MGRYLIFGTTLLLVFMLGLGFFNKKITDVPEIATTLLNKLNVKDSEIDRLKLENTQLRSDAQRLAEIANRVSNRNASASNLSPGTLITIRVNGELKPCVVDLVEVPMPSGVSSLSLVCP